ETQLKLLSAAESLPRLRSGALGLAGQVSALGAEREPVAQAQVPFSVIILIAVFFVLLATILVVVLVLLCLERAKYHEEKQLIEDHKALNTALAQPQPRVGTLRLLFDGMYERGDSKAPEYSIQEVKVDVAAEKEPYGIIGDDDAYGVVDKKNARASKPKSSNPDYSTVYGEL
ncbi:unnamed protein product, partial [Mesorhabditis spiculigera]